MKPELITNYVSEAPPQESLRITNYFDFTPSIAVPPLLTWFEVIGYTVLLESEIATGRYGAQRRSNTEVVLYERLRSAVQRINSTIPSVALETAIYQVICTLDSDLLTNNRRFHQLLTEGINVTYQLNEQTVDDKVWLIDTSHLLNNDWLVIHPFIVADCSHCLDVVVFVNGLPLAAIAWISPSQEKATLQQAYQRIQSYKQRLPKLFTYNAFSVISCGNRARVGTLTSGWKEFLPWRTIDGEDFTPVRATELEVLIQGIFDKRRFLDLLQHFIVFEETAASITKQLLRHPFCTIRNPKSR